jgi:hypothetical protein
MDANNEVENQDDFQRDEDVMQNGHVVTMA